MIADCCFWSQRYIPKGRQPLLHLFYCCKPLPLWLKQLLGDLKGQHSPSSHFFAFSPLGRPDLKTFKNNSIYRESQNACPGKGSEKTLGLHLRLILSIEMPYKIPPNPPKMNKTIRKKQQTMGEGENLISKVTTLLDSNVQCSTTTTKQSQGI